MHKFWGVYQMSTEKEGSPETLILFTSDSRSAAKKIEKLPMEKAISLAMFKKRHHHRNSEPRSYKDAFAVQF
jgi:hypothetical protein